jgi:hypothetical protein
MSDCIVVTDSSSSSERGGDDAHLVDTPRWSESSSQQEEEQQDDEALSQREDEDDDDRLSSLSVQSDEQWRKVQQHAQTVLAHISRKARRWGPTLLDDNNQVDDSAAEAASFSSRSAAWKIVRDVTETLRQAPAVSDDAAFSSTPSGAPAATSSHSAAQEESNKVTVAIDVSQRLNEIAESLRSQEANRTPTQVAPPLPQRPLPEVPAEAVALLQRLASVAEAGLGAVGLAVGTTAKRPRDWPTDEEDAPSPKRAPPPLLPTERATTPSHHHSEDSDEVALRALGIEVKQLLAAVGAPSLRVLREKWADLQGKAGRYQQAEMAHVQQVAELQKQILIRDTELIRLQLPSNPILPLNDTKIASLLAAQKQIEQSLAKLKPSSPISTVAAGSQAKGLHQSAPPPLGGAAVLVQRLQHQLEAKEKLIASQQQTIQLLEQQQAKQAADAAAQNAKAALSHSQSDERLLLQALKKRHQAEMDDLRDAIPVVIGQHIQWTFEENGNIRFELFPLAEGQTPSKSAVQSAQDVLDRTSMKRETSQMGAEEDPKSSLTVVSGDMNVATQAATTLQPQATEARALFVDVAESETKLAPAETQSVANPSTLRSEENAETSSGAGEEEHPPPHDDAPSSVSTQPASESTSSAVHQQEEAVEEEAVEVVADHSEQSIEPALVVDDAINNNSLTASSDAQPTAAVAPSPDTTVVEEQKESPAPPPPAASQQDAAPPSDATAKGETSSSEMPESRSSLFADDNFWED